MKRNNILFVIALIVAIAFSGSAQALIQPLGGQINTSGALVNTATGQYITVYLDVNPSDYQTVQMTDNPAPYDDTYQFQDIEKMLLKNSFTPGQTYNATVVMYCSGTQRDQNGNPIGTYVNTHRNTTPTTAHVMGVYDGYKDTPSILDVEPCAVPDPDLIVTDVLINPGETRDSSILRLYVNQNNDISAVVQNNGLENVADNFDVCFEADGVKIGCATVTGSLSAGANTTVSIDWTPTCANYPVMPGFPVQSLPLTINVTVDCSCINCPNCPDGTCGTITESDETNNTLSKVIPAMQVYSVYDVIGGVVNNGYMSKNFDCDTTEEPLDQFKYYDLIGGGVEYNVNGEKISTFAPQATSTRVHHIDLPSGAVVQDARLYVYWYDKWGNYKIYPTGCLAELSVNFEGTDIAPDAAYQDSKGFGYYQSPKGSTVFDVTSLVSGSGDYTAIVKNIGGTTTTLLGEMLVVVYDGADHDRKVQIWMLEGTDYLYAADDTHGKYDFSVSPVKATATVAFSGGNFNLAGVDTARLITVVAQGMVSGSDMLFNGNVIKTDAWNAPTEVSGKINVEDVSVTSNLLASGNNMGFRDTGTGGMQASNVFLVVEYKKIPADVTFDKKKINLNSNGILKAFITLPEGYDVADIDVSTVECEGASVFGDGSVIPGKQALEVKFKIPNLNVPTGDEVVLTVTGQLYDGTRFEASNTLEVV